MGRKCYNMFGFIIGSLIVLIIRIIILLPYQHISDALRLVCRKKKLKKHYKVIKDYVDRIKNKNISIYYNY